MLATVMSHEGTHVYGNRVEGVAHLAGLQTYSQLGEMFKLKGNKTFTDGMVNALLDEKSWQENSGDVDYWLLDNDGKLTWDGHLNIYMEGETDINDAASGKKLDYRALDELIKNTNGDTVEFGGIKVSRDRLIEISEYNKEIFNNAISDNSVAAAELLAYGHLSYKTALKAQNDIRENYITALGNMNNQGIGVLFSAVPSMVDHYSTRYVLNENNAFAQYFSDEEFLKNWTNPRLKESKGEVSNGITLANQQQYGFQINEDYFSLLSGELKNLIPNDSIASLLSETAAVYHGEGCFKWCFNNGQEIVFNRNSNGKYQFDLNYNTMGTFNFGDPKADIEHFILDMDSYWKWGNTPDDLHGSKAYGWNATPILKRIHPKLQKGYDFIKTGWNNYNETMLYQPNYTLFYGEYYYVK